MSVNTVTKEQVLTLLLEKGFEFLRYEDQNLDFFTLTITNEQRNVLEKLFKEHYYSDYMYYQESDGDIYEHFGFVVEIKKDLSSSHWSFIGMYKMSHVFENLDEFYEFTKQFPDKLYIAE